MVHQKLPPKSKESVKPPVTPIQQKGVVNSIDDRATAEVSAGHRAYFLRFRLQQSSLSGFAMLSHSNRFEQSQFEDMVREAVGICNGTRINTRREGMAKAKTPVDDPVRINEDLFAGDIAFVEAVMCDKWGFKRLFVTSAESEIIPTIKLNA